MLCGHSLRTLLPMRKTKRRIHITMANPLADALEALAVLEGRTISELLDDVARQHLRARGYEPQVSPGDLATELSRRSKRK